MTSTGMECDDCGETVTKLILDGAYLCDECWRSQKVEGSMHSDYLRDEWRHVATEQQKLK